MVLAYILRLHLTSNIVVYIDFFTLYNILCMSRNKKLISNVLTLVTADSVQNNFASSLHLEKQNDKPTQLVLHLVQWQRNSPFINHLFILL